MVKRLLLCKLFFILFVLKGYGQTPYAINDQTLQHIFSHGEIQFLEDPSGKLTFNDILTPKVNSQFKTNKAYTPKTHNFESNYWFKVKITHNSQSKKNWILEFFDQTIDDLNVFVPIENGAYLKYNFGDQYKFKKREYNHKNFTVDIANHSNDTKTYYVKIKSSQSANAIIVLRNTHWFVQYALDEYIVFGLFYGMVLVFSLYNILMYFAIRQKQYLYYVLYNLSIGFYEMCVDGIAFQYLWPNFPAINQISFGVGLYLSSVFGLLFTLNFLYLKNKSPLFYRLVLSVILLRTLFFVFCVFNNEFFSYKIVEIIPLLTAYTAGLYVYFNGYKPARFFVLGYSFLFVGFMIKLLIYLNVSWLSYGPITHYSLSFSFVIEMIFVSFAIGDNIRHLRKKKDKVQKRMIAQLQENEKLKDNMNQELTFLVDERTKELRQKADIILKQSEEISRMNALLKEDNEELQVSIEKVTRARVMSQDVDFEEFSKIYPDRDTCYKYLSDLKWKTGYQCRKCGSDNYLSGQLPYSRRCTKCRYEESVINNTIFQNSRIPINKAFYMLYLIYTTKGKISSHKLSEILSIRQGTCWSYSSKMKKLLEDRKKEIKNAGAEGWSKIVLEHPPASEG
jgi:hypothetical protein